MKMKITRTPTSQSFIEFSDIPNATAIVSVGGPKARMLADLVLHRLDLSMALGYLDAITNESGVSDLEAEGLCMAALTRLYKCFGNSKSRQAYLLDPQKILGHEPGGMDAFNHYKAERNKHVVHDENAFSQAFVGAAINDGTHSHKVERVISLACDMQLFTEENWQNLRLLTSKTLEFVIAETERLSAEVKADLEQESYETLAAREPITYKSPVGTNPLKRRDQSHLN